MVKYDDMRIAARLKYARKSAGFRQGDVAPQLGMVRTTLVAIEQGTRAIHHDELQAMARLYRVSEEWLLGTVEGHEDPLLPLVGNPQVIKAMKQVDAARAATKRAVRAELRAYRVLYDAVRKCLPPGSMDGDTGHD